MLWLDAHPMILDLAHMSERSFWNTVSTSRGPLVVSHANARALCDHPRNLWDDQLRAIADRDGVVGVVFSTRFLDPTRQATVSRVVDHIEYMLDVMGADHVAIGFDFGGLVKDRMPDLNSVERIGLLITELRTRGFAEYLMEHIVWHNAARTIEASLSCP